MVITLGGIGTVVAILLVVVVLVVSAIPLFFGTRVNQEFQVAFPVEKPLGMGCDEYGRIAWILDPSGRIQFVAAELGIPIASAMIEPPLDPSDSLSACVMDENGTQLAIGTKSGKFQLIELGFETSYRNWSELEPAQKELLQKAPQVIEGKLCERVAEDLVRQVHPKKMQWGERHSLSEHPIRLIEIGPKLGGANRSQSILAVAGDEWIYGVQKSSVNLLTKKVKQEWRMNKADLKGLIEGEVCGFMICDRGDRAMMVSTDGQIGLYQQSVDSAPKLIDSFPLKRVDAGRPTVASRLLGRSTLMIGDTSGNVLGAFVAKSERASEEANPERIVVAHEVSLSDQPIVTLVPSPTMRLMAASSTKGPGKLIYVPTDEEIASFSTAGSSTSKELLAFSPRGDHLIQFNGAELTTRQIALGYPEASLGSLFGRLWYEGYNEPKYIWQSSASNVATEIKLSMLPLIFGTLKATFYTLLISVPLAIMAAIFSSEFMDRKWRSRVKPAIEFMASIPSVVLGFTSAFVLAPWLRESLDWTWVSIAVVPVVFLLAAHLWCLLPVNAMIRWNWLRLPLMACCLPIAILLAYPIAPSVQNMVFGTDLKSWLNQTGGYAHGGWFILLLPLSAMAIGFVWIVPLGQATRVFALGLSPLRFGFFNLLRFGLGLAAVVITAYCASHLAEWLVGDIRGSIYGVYQERNATLVGFVLGFAVIPIIYTISEDALQAVPQHLRSASLGCGATPWQTTIRVVVPTAMSGLFSAVMIGFGRAVGETMVVLMAAGNTPIMDLNPFSGYRTLSATLATELPEAAVGSAHYRTLFLAALLLFAMTLVANLAAEFVRMRFRKRAYQL